jgi:hypothetical protein
MFIEDNGRSVEVRDPILQEKVRFPPTGIKEQDGEKVTWHEVQFLLGDDIMCQCAVVNGEYVALTPEEVKQFVRIIKVWHPDELGG